MSAAQAGSSNGLAGLGGLQGGLPTGGLRRASASSSDDFAGALKSALHSVSDEQRRSAALQREVMLENPKVSLEETMVAMQRAQISFQSALHIRNRMMQAYTDIMNMQV
ncbi:MAG: flagellar hook-basal body complex protein FliE [Betaproteobacteria bacterium]|nr:flagellar hook-basal body complex protein FliE [Betaproteobacteria bacterium]